MDLGVDPLVQGNCHAIPGQYLGELLLILLMWKVILRPGASHSWRNMPLEKETGNIEREKKSTWRHGQMTEGKKLEYGRKLLKERIKKENGRKAEIRKMGLKV